MKNATPKKYSEYTKYIQNIYTLTLVIDKMINIFNLSYKGLHKISNDDVINGTYYKLKSIYSQIINKYKNKKEYKIKDNIIDLIPEYLSEPTDDEADFWWNDSKKESQFIRQKEILQSEISKYIDSEKMELQRDYFETFSIFFKLSFEESDKYIYKIIQMKKKEDNTLLGKNTSPEESSIFYIDKDDNLIHYEKGILRQINENNNPLYLETFKIIIKKFPNNSNKISIKDFNKKLSSSEKKKLQIKNGSEYKSRLSSAGRSFYNFLSENNILNTHPINKKDILRITNTHIELNNKIE